MRFVNDNGALVFYKNGEMVRIEAWGKDSLRVRSTMQGKFTDNQWALTEPVEDTKAEIIFEMEPHWIGSGGYDERDIVTV